MASRAPHRRLRRAVLAAALSAAALAPGCSRSRAPAFLPRHPRPEIEAPVLVLGLDGFEWSVVLPLVAEGRMPALAALMERGVVGKLGTLDPTISPRLWTTIATGKPPEEHGILAFAKEPRPSDGKRLAYTSFDRKVKAFWNILGEWGLSSDTIGWWMTYPVEEVLGLMVAQTNTEGVAKGSLRDGMHGQVWPPEEEERVLALLAESDVQLAELEQEIFGAPERFPSRAALRRFQECRWALRADSTYVRVLHARLDRGPPSDVTALYLGGPDVVGHRFWAAHEPASAGLAPDAPEVRAFGHVVRAYYAWVDRVLAALLARFPADTTVFVVSDHGMTLHAPLRGKTLTQEDLDGYTGHHLGAEPGVFVAAGKGIARPGKTTPPGGWTRDSLPVLGGIHDFCPTLLALLGVPAGADMRGEPLTALLEPARLERCPPATIPTHDDDAWRRSREIEVEIEEDPERLEQLERLGYLGAPREDG